MPNIHCRCGNLITLGSIPSENKFHILPDTKVEELIHFLSEMKDEFHLFEVFYGSTTELAKCSVCRRIWIDEGHSGEFKPYKEEVPD